MSINTSSSLEKLNQLNTATVAIVVTLAIINIPAGLMGQVLNIFVFTRPKLRQQACSFYFLTSAYTNLLIVMFILPIRVLSGGFKLDPANLNVIICKMEFFIFNATRSLSMWLITLVCIDRYLSTLVNENQRNRFSSTKIAKRLVLGTAVIIYSSYSHTLVFYYLVRNTDPSDPNINVCKVPDATYRLFFALFHAVIYSILPCLAMFIFGTLTLMNIRRHRSQVGPILTKNQAVARRSEAELIRMLTVQVLVIIVTTIVFPIYQTYASITANTPKSTLRIAEERLANQIVAGIGNIPHTSSFYLYTLVGTVFRHELKKTLMKVIPAWSQTQRTKTTTTAAVSYDRNRRNDLTEVSLQIMTQK